MVKVEVEAEAKVKEEVEAEVEIEVSGWLVFFEVDHEQHQVTDQVQGSPRLETVNAIIFQIKKIKWKMIQLQR